MGGPGLVNVVGVSRLDDHLLLAEAGLAMAMVAAGADRLVDLRGETRPPGLPVQIDHFPILDLEPGQDELILAAARHIAGLAEQGVTVGLYCQAGISRTSTVAIAYLLVRGVPLDEASRAVREARPQAMPALELRRSLERIAAAMLTISGQRYSPGRAKKHRSGRAQEYRAVWGYHAIQLRAVSDTPIVTGRGHRRAQWSLWT